MSPRHKALTLLLLLIAAGVAAERFGLGASLAAVLVWVGAHRDLAWAVYIGAYVVATVIVVPGTLLTLGAGFLFGLPLGVATVSAGSVLGASCAFLIGRFLARDWIAQHVAGRTRLHALDRATRRNGFLVVFLVRLSPLFPFNLVNYALGVTGVRFRDYFLASWIGMLPATVLYVYIGTLAKSVTELTSGTTSGGWGDRALLIVGLLATIALTVLIARKARRALDTQLQTEQSES